MRKLRKFKALDERTGRLERAINLVEDGYRPGVKVHRREADAPHPQDRPVTVGLDRVQLLGATSPRSIAFEGAAYVYRIGFSASAAALHKPPTAPILTISSGLVWETS